jgi:hypothetical protein
MDVRMSEEQKYISKWIRSGFTQKQIMDHLYQSGYGKERKAQGWPNLKDYNTLRAVGDKCGWDAVNEYRKRGAPVDLIKGFESFMGMPVKTVVTMRHPLDNITAWVDSSKYKRIYTDEGLRYRRMIRRYKQFHDAAWEILQHTDYKIIHNEELIADTEVTLQDLTDWIGLPKDPKWLSATSERIWKKPHERRHDIEWPHEYVDRVNAFIAESPLLEYYRA